MIQLQRATYMYKCANLYLVCTVVDLHVANKGGKTTQKSTSAAQQKQKISDSDEDFMASDDEGEKRSQPKTKGKVTPKERTSTNIDNSDEDIRPPANKKTKRKRELESESDDENVPLRPEKKQDVKPGKPVSRDDSSGSTDDEDVQPASKVCKTCH